MGFFKEIEGAPAPIIIKVKRRIMIREVDAMGVVWFGRYADLIEEAAIVLHNSYNISYKELYDDGAMHPMVQYHMDYHLPLTLNEEITIKASCIWTESARFNIEYELIKEDGRTASKGYTVQLFIDSESRELLLTPPDIIEKFRERWANGELKNVSLSLQYT